MLPCDPCPPPAALALNLPQAAILLGSMLHFDWPTEVSRAEGWRPTRMGAGAGALHAGEGGLRDAVCPPRQPCYLPTGVLRSQRPFDLLPSLQARKAQERAHAAAEAEAADHRGAAAGEAAGLLAAAGGPGGAAEGEGGAAGQAAEGEGPPRVPPLHAGMGSRHGVYEPLLTAEHVV